MAYISRFSLNELDGNADFANAKGNHECVVLVQKTAGLPNTGMWTKGKKVMDEAADAIKTGTVIATFDKDGNYPLENRHAAIYESHDKGGINVIDQWNSKGKATRRKINMKKGATRSVDDADWYYVVETK